MKWLLLRGLTREQRHWGSFLSKFQNEFGVDNVFCLDHVGAGTEIHRKSPTTVSEMADDLRSRWLELRAFEQEPWGIVSLSLGSMVSLDWCARFAQDFRFQVIMNTSSLKESKPWERMILNNLPKFVTLSKASNTIDREASILKICSNLLSASEKSLYAKTWGAFALSNAQLLGLGTRQLMAASRFQSPDVLTTPTLALASAADRLVNPECTLRIAERLKTAFEIHPTAGHELTLDDPDWVIAKIKSFVS